jgi:hypothetical protein
MTGQIIQFDKYGELPRAQLYREQSPPRGLSSVRRLHGPAQSDRGGQNAGAEAGKARNLERQVARISGLLDELEELARTAADVPPAAQRQARVGVERARAILQLLQASECEADIEGDPQPRLNDEELERMYRHLHPET